MPSPKINVTISLVQYCTLIRKLNEYVEKWMGHLRIKANKCWYKEKDRILKKAHINCINDHYIRTEIYNRIDSNQNNKWTHQWASIRMSQGRGGTEGLQSTNWCHKGE